LVKGWELNILKLEIMVKILTTWNIRSFQLNTVQYLEISHDYVKELLSFYEYIHHKKTYILMGRPLAFDSIQKGCKYRDRNKGAAFVLRLYSKRMRHYAGVDFNIP
jgi:hypothetical protein